MTSISALDLGQKDAQMGVSYRDLRDYLRIVEGRGDLKRINGADPQVELGTIAELMAERLA